MKRNQFLTHFIVACALAATSMSAGETIPKELEVLVHTDLESGQNTMTQLGYEIVYSSYFKKVQYYWKESTQACVSLTMKGKDIDSFKTIDKKECTSRLEAARKVREKYFDGGAPVHNSALDAERKKLSDGGYKASYWVKDAAPSKSIEYWWNEASRKCSYVVFVTNDGTYVQNGTCEAKQAKNPAPGKK